MAPFASRAVGPTTITTFFSLGVAPGAGDRAGDGAGTGDGPGTGAGGDSAPPGSAGREPLVAAVAVRGEGATVCGRSRRQRVRTLSSWETNRSTSPGVIPIAAAAVR